MHIHGSVRSTPSAGYGSRRCTTQFIGAKFKGSLPMQNNSWTRRNFLAASALAVTAPSLLAAETTRYRAAIIGHTGAGDYGHGLDVVFTGRDNIEVVAVA